MQLPWPGSWGEHAFPMQPDLARSRTWLLPSLTEGRPGKLGLAQDHRHCKRQHRLALLTGTAEPQILTRGEAGCFLLSLLGTDPPAAPH